LRHISIVNEVFQSIERSIPREITGFPRCQVCHRKVTNAFAGTDGRHWIFGHLSCTPNYYWMGGKGFESLAAILDWAFHLAQKQEVDLGSWIEVVECVRPEWAPAVRELVHRYFSAPN
jgi:hypothetical protein